MKVVIALASLGALAASPPAADGKPANNASILSELRAAEARLIAHLQGDDPLAWVGDYAEDAVFQEGDGEPVAGRAALTEVALAIGPLSNVVLVPVRTEVQGNLAYVQVRASYAVGPEAGPTRWYRGVMIWRKEGDGVWRMLHEMLAPQPGQ